jgi:hypothetical protein
MIGADTESFERIQARLTWAIEIPRPSATFLTLSIDNECGRSYKRVRSYAFTIFSVAAPG